MSELTPKQERFCTAYLEKGTAIAAYKEAYDCEKMSDGAIYVEAHRLTANPKIALRLEELKAPVVESARCTLEGHLKQMAKLRDLAIESTQYSAAIKAEEQRGKAVGLYKDQIDLSSSDGSMRPQAIELIGVLADVESSTADTE